MRLPQLLLLLLTICSVSPATGQRLNQHADKYRDLLEKGSKLLRSGYHYTFEQTPDKTYLYKQYFPETRQLTHYITYADKNGYWMEGPYAEYLDDGTVLAKGNCLKNQRRGTWQLGDYTSPWISEGLYVDGFKEKEWITRDSMGRITERTHYLNDRKNGVEIRYDSLGLVKDSIVYLQDSIVYQRDQVTSLDGRENMPRFNHPECEVLTDDHEKYDCAQKKMLEYIYYNVRYPAIARENGIQGRAVIVFVIGKDGSVTDVKVARGLCQAITNECYQIMRGFTKWIPGRQRGEPVRVQFTLPISFKLQ